MLVTFLHEISGRSTIQNTPSIVQPWLSVHSASTLDRPLQDKRLLAREDFENFVPKGFTTSQNHVLCANFVKLGRPGTGKVVRYLPDKK